MKKRPSLTSFVRKPIRSFILTAAQVEEILHDKITQKVLAKVPQQDISIVELAERIINLLPPPLDEKRLAQSILSQVPEVQDVELDTPDEVVAKVNKAKKKIKSSSIENFDTIESYARSANDKIQKYLLMGGSTLVKLQADGVPLGDFSTLNFINGTVTNTAGTANYTSTSGGGSGYQAPLTGGLSGTNKWTTAPNVIVIDGIPRQKIQTDGTIMWTGTTTTTLTTNTPVPTFDIFSSA